MTSLWSGPMHHAKCWMFMEGLRFLVVNGVFIVFVGFLWHPVVVGCIPWISTTAAMPFSVELGDSQPGLPQLLAFSGTILVLLARPHIFKPIVFAHRFVFIKCVQFFHSDIRKGSRKTSAVLSRPESSSFFALKYSFDTSSVLCTFIFPSLSNTEGKIQWSYSNSCWVRVRRGLGGDKLGLHSWWISHSLYSWLGSFLPTTFKPTAPCKIRCILERISHPLSGAPSPPPETWINQGLVLRKKRRRRRRGKRMDQECLPFSRQSCPHSFLTPPCSQCFTSGPPVYCDMTR